MSGAAHSEVNLHQSNNTNVVKRTLFVNVTGSLGNLALAGPQAAMWKPIAGKETELFAPTLDASMPSEASVETIRNGTIRSVVLKEAQSTFPCPMGVSISCVPNNEVTELGERFAYTVLPNSVISSPQVIYTCDGSLETNESWRQQYARWNKNNLESEGVITIPGQTYLFVDQDHPMVGLLRHNQELIGCDVDKMPKMDGKWLKLSTMVMNECCRTLRAQVLSKVNTHDLNMFNLQLKRLDAQTWDDIGDGTVALQGFKLKSKWSPEQVAEEKRHHLDGFLTNKYQYLARLEIEYEVPTTPTVA